MAKTLIGNIKGKDGRGISKIEKTATTGVVDTYTITYTDGTRFNYTVKNADNVAIQRQIVTSAAIESSTAASQAYTAGDYVVVGGVLRKVKSSIAKGSTIGDSNSTATTVMGEIKTVRDSVSREVGYQFLYGKDFSGQYVAYRKKGFLVEMVWNFLQETTIVWNVGTLPVGFRPAQSFRMPSVRTKADGGIDNSTALVEVQKSGGVIFNSAYPCTGGSNVGHCVWIAN